MASFKYQVGGCGCNCDDCDGVPCIVKKPNDNKTMQDVNNIVKRGESFYISPAGVVDPSKTKDGCFIVSRFIRDDIGQLEITSYGVNNVDIQSPDYTITNSTTISTARSYQPNFYSYLENKTNIYNNNDILNNNVVVVKCESPLFYMSTNTRSYPWYSANLSTSIEQNNINDCSFSLIEGDTVEIKTLTTITFKSIEYNPRNSLNIASIQITLDQRSVHCIVNFDNITTSTYNNQTVVDSSSSFGLTLKGSQSYTLYRVQTMEGDDDLYDENPFPDLYTKTNDADCEIGVYLRAYKTKMSPIDSYKQDTLSVNFFRNGYSFSGNLQHEETITFDECSLKGISFSFSNGNTTSSVHTSSFITSEPSASSYYYNLLIDKLNIDFSSNFAFVMEQSVVNSSKTVYDVVVFSNSSYSNFVKSFYRNIVNNITITSTIQTYSGSNGSNRINNYPSGAFGISKYYKNNNTNVEMNDCANV